MLIFISFIIFAYLLGSLSSAIIICKLMHLPDPRTQGSGNPGATNILRFGGKKLAIIVLLGDALKGVIPILLAKLLGFSSIEVSFIAVAAFLGHLFPLFFGFKGGKGVATALGVMLALAWPVALFALTVWLIMVVVFRYSSLAALTAAILAPVCAFFICTIPEFVAIVIISLILIARHYENIQRLVKGVEGKMSFKKTAAK